MLLPRSTSDAFAELRIAVGKELLSSYKELIFRAYQQVPPLYWASLYVTISINEMTELSIEAVTSGDFTALESWMKSHVSPGFETDVIQRIILFIKNEIMAVCSRLIPEPSPLIAELRMKFSELERIVTGKRRSRARSEITLLHDPLDVLVDDLLSEIDDKDDATGAHSRHVASWCYRLAVKLGLSAEETFMVTRGGLIHDIGKVAVPDAILKAPRRLTDEERTIMESHVTVGYDMIVSSYPLLHKFTSMVRNHHERIDGRGYPDKLGADEIPLLTRIVTVADCYNAMVGLRPYRRAMSPEVAVQQIREHRGKQFDPDVADAMIELTNEDNRESRNLKVVDVAA